MEFYYEVSEKAAPFLKNCDMGDEEVCKEFKKEAVKQWDIIKDKQRGKTLKEWDIILSKERGKETTDADDKEHP